MGLFLVGFRLGFGCCSLCLRLLFGWCLVVVSSWFSIGSGSCCFGGSYFIVAWYLVGVWFRFCWCLARVLLLLDWFLLCCWFVFGAPLARSWCVSGWFLVALLLVSCWFLLGFDVFPVGFLFFLFVFG